MKRIPLIWKVFGWLTAAGAGTIFVVGITLIGLGNLHWGFAVPCSLVYFGVAGLWGWIIFTVEHDDQNGGGR